MDDLLSDYFFLRIGDPASLTFCNGWLDAPDETGHAVRFDGKRMLPPPDPFGGETRIDRNLGSSAACNTVWVRARGCRGVQRFADCHADRHGVGPWGVTRLWPATAE